ncbi:uncharacterized protein V1510DRAFT_402466 [Dipodascopsis tothii]|uniref:uncharacterized protein n=1 Tax=Dipodascopsis tothii TaxID=44089 RepID=UPI0034CDEF8D
MSFFTPAAKGLHAVIPADPPPSKREKVAKYLRAKKDQFDQYQKLLQSQQKELIGQRSDGRRRPAAGQPSQPAPNQGIYRLLSSTSFSSFAKAAQEQQPAGQMRGRGVEVEDADDDADDDLPAKRLDEKDGEKLVLFPSYARRLDNGLVEIDIRGWVYARGTPNRTNRLFTSVVRQIVGVGEDEAEAPAGDGPPSPSSRYNNKRYQDVPSPTTAAVSIPKSSAASAGGPGSPRRAQGGSPSSPSLSNFGTSPGNLSSSLAAARNPSLSRGTLPRQGAFPSRPSSGGSGAERQPLMASGRPGSINRPYSVAFSSSDESSDDDYSDSDSDDEVEVVDNHHETRVVERRASVGRSASASASVRKMARSQSFYQLMNAESNSQLVAVNATGEPLSASPINTSMNAYFANFKGSGTVPGRFSPTRSNTEANLLGSSVASYGAVPAAEAPPPLPQRPQRPQLLSFKSIYNADKALQERIAPFISQPLAHEVVTIQVGSTATENYSTYNVLTTDSGHFGVRLRLNYDPAIVVVECGENLVSIEEVKIVEPFGVSMISDIDDTVKHTGITGAKKGIFRNVFVKDYAELEIKGVAEWFQDMDKKGVQIHYVSNSPWQLYPSIAKFLRRAGLPRGSMHLKHYNGFLYGLLEPKVQKKKFNLESILMDFPYRKFVLVGDSGEMDLEAYVNLACAFPDNILAIYIRDVTTMCTDDDDFCSVSELQGFFTSSVPRPDEIDDLKYYQRPHSPPPLMPKPRGMRAQTAQTAQPTPTNMAWSGSDHDGRGWSGSERDQRSVYSAAAASAATGASDDAASIRSSVSSTSSLLVGRRERAKAHPTVPRKPVGLRAPSGSGSPGSSNVLSTSVASTISPMAERLAKFSSTFNDDEPETPGHTIRDQEDYFVNSMKKSPETRPPPRSSLSSSLNATQASGASLAQDVGITKPLLPPRPPPAPERKPVLEPKREGPLLGGMSTGGIGFGRPHIGNAAGSLLTRSGPGAAVETADKRLENWKRRVARARMMLPQGIKLRMWRIGEDVRDECDALVQDYLNSLEKGH